MSDAQYKYSVAQVREPSFRVFEETWLPEGGGEFRAIALCSTEADAKLISELMIAHRRRTS